MGGATRWFKRLFGTKKSLVSDKGRNDSGHCKLPTDPVCLRTFLTDSEREQNKNATAVATPTAITAKVAGLTGERKTGDIITRDERWAVVKIQKVFRGSLARKALRALKGIVKLQALVRGYLVRKRAAAVLHSMQTLIRVQTAMRSKRNRRLNKEYRNMSQPRYALEKFDDVVHDERRSKDVEMDGVYKRRSYSRQKHNVASMSEHEDGFVYQRNDLELNLPKEKWKFSRTPRLSSSLHHQTANNRYYVMMQSPGKSGCGNALSEYGMSTPGYMEKTQSFKAKQRSHSAPHQRSERMRFSLDEVFGSTCRVTGESLQQQRFSSS